MSPAERPGGRRLALPLHPLTWVEAARVPGRAVAIVRPPPTSRVPARGAPPPGGTLGRATAAGSSLPGTLLLHQGQDLDDGDGPARAPSSSSPRVELAHAQEWPSTPPDHHLSHSTTSGHQTRRRRRRWLPTRILPHPRRRRRRLSLLLRAIHRSPFPAPPGLFGRDSARSRVSTSPEARSPGPGAAWSRRDAKRP